MSPELEPPPENYHCETSSVSSIIPLPAYHEGLQNTLGAMATKIWASQQATRRQLPLLDWVSQTVRYLLQE